MAGVCPMGYWDARLLKEPPKLLDMAISYAKSAISAGVFGNKAADKNTYSLRVISCFGDSESGRCKNLAYEQNLQFHYCATCGCGGKIRAKLSVAGSDPVNPKMEYDGAYTKLHYPYLECPEQRKGFSNAKAES